MTNDPTRGAIDVVMNLHTPEVIAEYRAPWIRDFLSEKIGADEEAVNGISLDRLCEKMDRAGVDKALLIAAKCGPLGHPANWQLPDKVVAEAVAKHPDRFLGLAGVDPTQGMRGVAALEYAVKQLGFVGAHLYPHWFEMAPDHRKYYPFYAKCVELDVPIQMQVGHCLSYSADRPLRSVGRPITLDTIACDFPELKLIGIHTGWPWVEEMIAVAYKHPNVYIGTDAFAPKHWKPEFIHYINTFGQDKVVFGTDYPVIDPERATREIDSLELRPEAKRKLMVENAARLYRIEP